MQPPDNRARRTVGDVVEVHLGGSTVRLGGTAVPPRGERLTLWWGVTSTAVALAGRLLDGPSLSGKTVIELWRDGPSSAAAPEGREQ